MILPGLSGSYILMLLGNYQLLMVTSINSLFDFLKAISTGDWDVLSTHPEMSNQLIYFDPLSTWVGNWNNYFLIL